MTSVPKNIDVSELGMLRPSSSVDFGTVMPGGQSAASEVRLYWRDATEGLRREERSDDDFLLRRLVEF